MATIFTRIIAGEIPGTFVWRDDLCAAFMSINPLRDGHVLVVPHSEVDHWLDCPPELRDHLMDVSATVGRALHSVYRSQRVGLMIAGLEVPHLHIHLLPIDAVHDMDFSNAAAAVDREHLETEAGRIRTALTELGAAGVSD